MIVSGKQHIPFLMPLRRDSTGCQCVMTTYLKDEKEGSEAIRKIAALTYSYFDRVSRASEYGRVVSPK
ncbi:MAG TPA: hypothetical protein VKV30_04530 [Candidatus Angelobacter sp.]|nr:hypothetical protein [Candidatus Angelobacter sp.]